MMKMNVQFRDLRSRLTAVLVLLMVAFCPGVVLGEPTGPDKARDVVAGWLKMNPQPLGIAFGRQIERIEPFRDADDQVLYYVVCLKGGGYVIVPADDAVEPILCFVETGVYDPAEGRPLPAIVSRDVSGRITAVSTLDTNGGGLSLQGFPEDVRALTTAVSDARAKWDRLTSAAASVTVKGLPALSDIRVEPLTQSAWGQTTIGSYIGGTSCYNYYTPTPPDYEHGNPYNYPIGCVAAAMSQLMRYHEYPGTYTWSNMPLVPDGATTLAQRQAIGWLCYQAAESIDTAYASGGSSASLDDAYSELIDTFGYSTTAIARNPAMGTAFNNMANTNLDAGLPVLLGIKGASSHAVVCDGYGYNAATLYHHLNMGWSGHDNAWYALPIVDVSPSYNSVRTCVYNIFTSGSGEIVSGRATDMAGNPIPDVQIAATPAGYATRYATTDIRGIFAFTDMPSNKYVTLTAAKPPHTFANKAATTGLSSDYGGTGNVWGINFVSTSTTPPTAYSQATSATSGVITPIYLSAGDDGQPNPPGRITYEIAILPLHATLSDPAGGEITTLPHTLENNGNIVNYRACSYYSGPDEFYFTADDGGTPPEGGDSDPALVTVDVNSVSYTTYEPQTNSAAPWPFGTSYEDSRTQVLYLSADVGGPKTITALALDVYERPGYQLNYWTIRMKHTTRSNFAFPPFFETTGWTTVYFNHEGRPTTGWYEFDFQTPFEYDGVSNLIIDFSHDNNSWDTDGYCKASETYEKRVIMGFSDSMHGDPLYWNDNTFWPYYPYYATAVPNIRLKSEAGGESIIGDFVQNCSVDIVDLVAFSNAWLSSLGEPYWCPECNIIGSDNIINEFDFAAFAEHWGETTE